jgi:hypothetical protein
LVCLLNGAWHFHLVGGVVALPGLRWLGFFLPGLGLRHGIEAVTLDIGKEQASAETEIEKDGKPEKRG